MSNWSSKGRTTVKYVAYFEGAKTTFRYETHRPGLAELWLLIDPPHRVYTVTRTTVPFTKVS